MFRTVRTVWIAVALLAAGTLVSAQAGAGFGDRRPPMERAFGAHAGHGQWWNDPQTVERLKLSDEQRKSMDQILLQHREKLIDMRATVEKAELGMEPLLKADQPNESEILSQIDKLAQARAELEKANARFLLALRAKLTPEQWKQLQADRAERRDWRRDGPRGGRGVQGPRHQGMPPAGGSPGAPPQGGPGAGPQIAPPDGAGQEGMMGEPFNPGPPVVSEIETID